jgi:hypothetical protein
MIDINALLAISAPDADPATGQRRDATEQDVDRGEARQQSRRGDARHQRSAKEAPDEEQRQREREHAGRHALGGAGQLGLGVAIR